MSRVSFWDTECEHEDAKVGSTNLEFARLLADDGLKARLRTVAAAVQSQPGSVKGADLIEHLALTGEPASG